MTPAVELSGSIDLRAVWVNLCRRNCLPPTGVSEGQLAPWILWQLWISTNSLCFNKTIMEEETITKALRMAREWIGSQEKITKPTPKKQPTPNNPENCALLRTDAAWRATNQQAGLGWKIKHQTGSSGRNGNERSNIRV